MSSSLVAAIIVGNVAIALATFGRVILQSERSKFRYSYWQIRDTLVDALVDGRLTPHKRLFEYIDRVEVLIEGTQFITPYQLWRASQIMRAHGWTPSNPEPYVGQTPSEQRILEEAKWRARNARARLLALGSPSGWLSVLTLPVWAPVITWRHRDEFREFRAAERRREAQFDTVAAWGQARFGSPSEIVRPMVRPPANGKPRAERRVAYV